MTTVFCTAKTCNYNKPHDEDYGICQRTKIILDENVDSIFEGCPNYKDKPQTDTYLTLEWSCSFSECDNFENFGLNERCVKCKQMQRKATKPQTMPIKKTMTGSKGERIEYTEAEIVIQDKISDLIKRSDAIKWFEPYANRGLKIPVETVIQNLKDIPSCEDCEQQGRCDRGRAVDCPMHKKREDAIDALQTYCDTCKHDLWNNPEVCGKCVGSTTLGRNPRMYEPKTEPQTERSE